MDWESEYTYRISKGSNYTAGCTWATTQEDLVEFHVSVEDEIPRGSFNVGSADAAMAVREGGAEIGEDFRTVPRPNVFWVLL